MCMFTSMSMEIKKFKFNGCTNMDILTLFGAKVDFLSAASFGCLATLSQRGKSNLCRVDTCTDVGPQ